jgi:L-arabinonolactonase
MQPEVAVQANDAHGEGVFWSQDHRLLYWTDILGERVWTWAPDRGEAKAFATPGKVCCFATRRGRAWNEVVAAFADGFAFLDLLTGARRDIAAIDAGLQGVRLNDGRTDRQGRFLAGGMNEASPAPLASMWRLDTDLTVTRLFGDVSCANGACFSPDGRTFWYADSGRGDIEAFDYDVTTGTPSGRRSVAKTAPSGVPDGSCVDSDGFVWNAVWEGYRVVRYAPDGRTDRVINVPVRKPTCCAFGGDDLGTLFITSSRLGESAESLAAEPLAGSLFAIRPGIVGVPDEAFAG